MHLEYELHKKVKIDALNRPGVIVGIYIGDLGVQYQVRYFDNAEPRTLYFFPWELVSL